MAIASVHDMVNERLPYTANVSYDDQIEATRIQMCYLMQNQTEKDDSEVEIEADYKPLENILFSMMVSYQMIQSKILQTMAGDGTLAGTAAKTLKRAKADVVEAEFIIVKAEDGALIQMKMSDYLPMLLNEICATARVLNYACPWCRLLMDKIPAFIVSEEPPQRLLPPWIEGFPFGTF